MQRQLWFFLPRSSRLNPSQELNAHAKMDAIKKKMTSLAAETAQVDWENYALKV